MTSDDINSELDELLGDMPDSDHNGDDETPLAGQFQALSSLGGYLGVYEELTTPSKDELLAALAQRGVRNADSESVFDFLLVDGETTTGFIRDKNGGWLERDLGAVPSGSLDAEYGELAKVASFLGLYDTYGLDGPSAAKLEHALITYGVTDVADAPHNFVAPLEEDDGETHQIGISTEEVTTAYPITADGTRIGDDEYTTDLLPKLATRLSNGADDTSEATVKTFLDELPAEVENLLTNEQVARNYQLMMHRLAEQASGEDATDATRAEKLAEARFITEVLSGERSWE